MNKLITIMFICTSFLFQGCAVKINNSKTVQLHVYGNCGMCKKAIEEAGSISGIAKVIWDKNTKMANVEYDTTQTNQEDILKRIAQAGYDSDNFLASEEAYNARPECCHYERNPKAVLKAK